MAISLGASAQNGTWTWVNGPDTVNGPGNFGTLGVASVNSCPKASYNATQWKDKTGNFWVLDWSCNLWQYDITANTWKWVKNSPSHHITVYGVLGVPSVTNNPGLRTFGCASWTDSTGDLWLFGGYGVDSFNTSYGILNDLWRYHIATNEWTWMGGSPVENSNGVYGTMYQPSDSAVPACRSEANTAWIDANNNLWLYGGEGNFNMGDMWRYNIGTGQWTWMGGSLQLNNRAKYGTLGVESPNNTPGARSGYAHWTDSIYLYMAGGLNYYGAQRLNDVWRFNLNTNYWTWVGGDTVPVKYGQYSHLCSTNYGDQPRGRMEQRATQINGCKPILYMFGGSASNGSFDSTLNDLWSFDLITRKWRWVSGDDSVSPMGNFGIKGVNSFSNVPPALMGVCFWSDNNGNLWVWGGQSHLGLYNAMWKYVPDPGCIPANPIGSNLNYQLTTNTICAGDSALISFTGGSAIIVSPANHVNWIDSAHAKLSPDTTTRFVISGSSACGTRDTLYATLQVASGILGINANKTTICLGDTAHICAPTGYVSYSWNDGENTACINVTSVGNYYVTATDNGNCSAASNSINISYYPHTQIAVHVHGDSLIASPGMSSYQWRRDGTPISGATSNIYVMNAGGDYTLQYTDTNGCPGLYDKGNVFTAIQENQIEGSINVFPNPTSTGWQLSVSNDLIGSPVEVYDATGRLVFKSIIENQQSSVNFTNAASGVYQLRINWQGYSFVKKLIKL